jgi:hypothetical protein
MFDPESCTGSESALDAVEEHLRRPPMSTPSGTVDQRASLRELTSSEHIEPSYQPKPDIRFGVACRYGEQGVRSGWNSRLVRASPASWLSAFTTNT